MRRWLREPLLQFAIFGGLLFSIGHDWGSEKRAIRVTEQRLAQFLQYQTRAQDLQTARRHLQDMNTAERDHLIDLYIREEALYRQAMDMQLAREDPVIKKTAGAETRIYGPGLRQPAGAATEGGLTGLLFQAS